MTAADSNHSGLKVGMTQTAAAHGALSSFVLSETYKWGPLWAHISLFGAESVPQMCICLNVNGPLYNVNLSLLKIEVVSSQGATLLCFGREGELEALAEGIVQSQATGISLKGAADHPLDNETRVTKSDCFDSVSSGAKAPGRVSKQRWSWALGFPQTWLDSSIFINVPK